MSQAPTPQASLFDDALNPAPAAPLAESHEPRPDPAVLGVKESVGGYSAKDIEVLEGLEPVRKRPGMYIGGTDERALHHLFAEVLDNAMDEAVAGHAKVIEVKLDAEGVLTVKDDGRGIPVDPHPKHPGKSALEVIMTVLHSGGKFSGKAYETSGGLHGVGVSVVNALSERVDVTAWKDGFEWRQSFSRGKPLGGIEKLNPTRKKGTAISFLPDSQIFGEGANFKPRQGLSVRRRRDPLELRSVPHPRPDAGRGDLPLPQRPRRLPGRAGQEHRDGHS
jgi:topoisomerase-4 subunit B